MGFRSWFGGELVRYSNDLFQVVLWVGLSVCQHKSEISE
jgi:hypothetical protein